MKITILTPLFLISVILAFIFLIPILTSKKPALGQACFKNYCFEVEISKTPAERQRGLTLRSHLDKEKGMLFVYEKEGNYSFWMKDTLIPLDIIWINQKKEVVFIQEEAQPCKEICLLINPSQNARYVLEVNGGLAEDIGIKIGDKFILDL